MHDWTLDREVEVGAAGDGSVLLTLPAGTGKRFFRLAEP
jgi:hypothetical protein